jgi:general secretion pathway protein B
MSYILDALKRSERERSLGSIEKLHTPDSGALYGNPRLPVILLSVVALLITFLVAMVWVYRAPLAELLGNEQSPAPGVQPWAETQDTTPRQGFLDSTRVITPDTRSEPTGTGELEESRQASDATLQLMPDTDAVHGAVGGEPVDLVSLPSEIRTRLPALMVSAVSFSEDAARRFVFIDGAIYREGEFLPEGILVEEIRRNRIILSTLSERFYINP